MKYVLLKEGWIALKQNRTIEAFDRYLFWHLDEFIHSQTMALGIFLEKLESSTIHGLAHISTSSRFVRMFWITVVITAMAIAGTYYDLHITKYMLHRELFKIFSL